MKKYTLLILVISVLLVMLSGCFKKTTPSETKQSQVPFSRGPSGPPVVGEPTTPLPSVQ